MRQHARSALIQLLNYVPLRRERPTVHRAWLLCRLLLLALCLGYYSLGDVRIQALAHFKDRPDLDNWFAGLRSKGGGMCCSFADGVAISDVDWDTQDGHYRVRLDGEWVPVPDDTVIENANKYGPAVVWPFPEWGQDGSKTNKIRCFMPGAGT